MMPKKSPPPPPPGFLRYASHSILILVNPILAIFPSTIYNSFGNITECKQGVICVKTTNIRETTNAKKLQLTVTRAIIGLLSC